MFEQCFLEPADFARKGGRNHRVFLCPVEAGPRKQIHMAFLDPRRHAVAVELDLVDAVRTGRRFWRPALKAAVRSSAGEAYLVLKRPLRQAIT
jgi:hypothetical protein